MDCGEIEIFPPRHFHIIEANDANVFRNAEFSFSDGTQCPDGQDIVAAEVAFLRVGLEQSLHFHSARIEGIIVGEAVAELNALGGFGNFKKTRQTILR